MAIGACGPTAEWWLNLSVLDRAVHNHRLIAGSAVNGYSSGAPPSLSDDIVFKAELLVTCAASFSRWCVAAGVGVEPIITFARKPKRDKKKKGRSGSLCAPPLLWGPPGVVFARGLD